MQAEDVKPKLLSRQQAARWLSLSLRKVDQLISDGDLRVARYGRAVRITEEALVECQRNREVPRPTTPTVESEIETEAAA